MFETLHHQFPKLSLQARSDLDPVLKTQLQQMGISPAAIAGAIYPQTQSELAEVLTFAHEQKWQLLPCGSGSKLSWGGIPTRVDWILSTAKLNRLIDHAVGDMTVTVEAGMKLADLQLTLAQAGQLLPLDPIYADQATVGGLIATASAGSLRQRYGGVRDLLLGITFARADGKLVKAGGRVVKNVAGYDMMKLFTGSFGTLGVLTQVTFRVYAPAATSETLLLTGDRSALAQALAHMNQSTLTPIALDALSPSLTQTLSQRDSDSLLIRFQSIAAGVQAQIESVHQLAQSLNLLVQSYQGEAESSLWQQLPIAMADTASNTPFLAKIGIKPQFIFELLAYLHQTFPQPTPNLLMHGSSGLGWLRWLQTTPQASPTSSQIQNLRQKCQDWGGYLTVLEADLDLKRQIEVWGYTGNALDLMQRLKQQFDPLPTLSPGRFIEGN